VQLQLNDFQLIVGEPLALLIPALAAALLFLVQRNEYALKFPSIRGMLKIQPSLRQRLYAPAMKGLIIGFVLCAGVAGARPQFIIKNDEQAYSRNIIAAIDASKSMLTRDIAKPGGEISRLDAVKESLKDFLSSREGDQVGLIVFGSDVFLRVPLTRDFDAVKAALDDVQVGIAGERTALGDAIAQSIKRIRDLPGGSRAIVVFTDGLNTAGSVEPLKAASVASSLGIRIYAIGVGKSAGELRTFGEREERSEEFDEYTLKKIAAATGGFYANASSSVELERTEREIDRREAALEVLPLRPVVFEAFVPLAAAASIILLLFLVLELTYFRKLP